MEKKTNKSPVEQMREWLQEQQEKYRFSSQSGGLMLAERKFNELFPEVQQVPIQDIDALADIEQIAKSYAESQSHNDSDASVKARFIEMVSRYFTAGYKQCLEDNKL